MLGFSEILGGLSLVGGIGGALFGSDDKSDEVYEMMKKRMAGIDPEILRKMRQRATQTIGNEAAGLYSQTESRMQRADAPIAKQEEVLAELAKRRMGAKGEAMTGIDIANEQYKMGAGAQMGALLPSFQGRGEGYGQMFGQGLNYFLQDQGRDKPNPFLEEQLQGMLKKQFASFNAPF